MAERKNFHLLFWVLLPVLILIAGVPFYTAHAWDLKNIAAATGLSAFCALLALTVYDAKKFSWAARGMAFLVFLLFAFYLGSQVLRGIGAHTWYPEGTRSTVSVPNAIKGFLVFGLPCLIYTIFGNTLFSKWGHKNKV
ncbi:MAG TPA: hypothetical protein P5561_02315 [Candidatus Omnitrophota bacterium]|nr:hypothetical protein [Candidatus Omnitrophota bacterium]HRY85351.1 hypothetical protein [Candidatus Omnitrophota bacterium]